MPRLWTGQIAIFCACLAIPGTALGSAPTVESIGPGVVPLGGEATLVVVGGQLKGASGALLYEAGLTCRKVKADSENEARITFAASADCRVGAHSFRVRSTAGLSELRVVHVGRFPVVAEVEPNDTLKEARVMPLNSTVTGVIDSGDVDSAAIVLRQGQQLSAEVEAVRFGGEMTDTLLIVTGPDGREIARVDDTPATRQDPSISLVAPAEGTYTIQVRDSNFGGGASNTYALHLGDFPRPSSIFPPGGQAGQTARMKLLGPSGERNADALALPDGAGPWFDYFPTVEGRTAPTSTPLRVRPYPAFDEVDLHESGASAEPEPREWPVAFQGAIGGPGDEDCWTILAREGDLIQAEVFAARVGSTLDAVLQVAGPAGDLITRNDDDETHDSRVVFRAATAGAYRITIRDKRGEGGPGSFYRLEVERPEPALTLFLAGPVRKSQERQVVAVPRGNRVIAWLGVRRDGFDTPVRVELTNLPSGVTADLREIPAGAYLTPVVFEAAADAPSGVSLVGIEGRATTSAGAVVGSFRQSIDLIQGPGDSTYRSVSVDRLAVVVTDEVPYRVALGSPRTPLARDGSIELVATVDRSTGFEEAVEVALLYLPPGVEMEGPAVVAAEETSTVLRLSARPDADPASWRLAAEARPAPPRRDRREMTLAVQAAAQAGGRRRASLEKFAPVSSAFVALELATAPVSGRLDPASAEQGKTVTLNCSLESAAPRAGTLLATLEGLPPRASAEPVEVAPGASSVAFRVSVAPTTPAGEHTSLACRLDGKVGDQPVVYRIGRGGVLKVNAPGSTTNGADGKPISPLDALRLKEREAGKLPPPSPSR